MSELIIDLYRVDELIIKCGITDTDSQDLMSYQLSSNSNGTPCIVYRGLLQLTDLMKKLLVRLILVTQLIYNVSICSLSLLSRFRYIEALR